LFLEALAMHILKMVFRSISLNYRTEQMVELTFSIVVGQEF